MNPDFWVCYQNGGEGNRVGRFDAARILVYGDVAENGRLGIAAASADIEAEYKSRIQSSLKMPITWKFVIFCLFLFGLWQEYLTCPRNSVAGVVRDKRQQTRSYVRETGRITLTLKKVLARLAGVRDNAPIQTIKVILYSAMHKVYYFPMLVFMWLLTLENPHIIYQ